MQQAFLLPPAHASMPTAGAPAPQVFPCRWHYCTETFSSAALVRRSRFLCSNRFSSRLLNLLALCLTGVLQLKQHVLKHLEEAQPRLAPRESNTTEQRTT